MKTNIRAVVIRGCIHAEETAGMGANHDFSHFARLLVVEGEFVCASDLPVGHSSLEALKSTNSCPTSIGMAKKAK